MSSPELSDAEVGYHARTSSRAREVGLSGRLFSLHQLTLSLDYLGC
jgi:hypothetical protein